MKANSAKPKKGKSENNPAPESGVQLRATRAREVDDSDVAQCIYFAQSILKSSRPAVVALVDAQEIERCGVGDSEPKLQRALAEVARIRDLASLVVCNGKLALLDRQKQVARILELEAALVDARTNAGAR